MLSDENWQKIDTVPIGRVVIVWGNLNPSDSLFSWREFLVQKKFAWDEIRTLDKNRLIVIATHWRELDGRPV